MKIFAFVAVILCALSTFAAERRNVGIQTFTFSKMTIEELLPVVRECGCDTIGLSNHALSAKFPKVMTNPDMTAQAREFLKKILAENKIKVAAYGVSTPSNEKGIRKLCDFAKEFGIKILLAEPTPDKLPLWDKICGEYGIVVAIHNHANDSKRNNYYDPRVVADLVRPYKNVFACPDSGHWARSGIDCESGLKTLSGKVAIVHFRDMSDVGNLSAWDVPLGSGKCGTDKMLAELDRQKFKGVLLLEYGGWWKNPPSKKIGEVKASVEYLRRN